MGPNFPKMGSYLSLLLSKPGNIGPFAPMTQNKQNTGPGDHRETPKETNYALMLTRSYPQHIDGDLLVNNQSNALQHRFKHCLNVCTVPFSFSYKPSGLQGIHFQYWLFEVAQHLPQSLLHCTQCYCKAVLKGKVNEMSWLPQLPTTWLKLAEVGKRERDKKIIFQERLQHSSPATCSRGSRKLQKDIYHPN